MALRACGLRERVKAGRLWHHACVWPGGRPCAYGAGPAEPAKRAQPIPPPVALSPLPGRTPTAATHRGRRQVLAVRHFAARRRVMRRRRPAETRRGEVRPPLADGVRRDRRDSWSARSRRRTTYSAEVGDHAYQQRSARIARKTQTRVGKGGMSVRPWTAVDPDVRCRASNTG